MGMQNLFSATTGDTVSPSVDWLGGTGTFFGRGTFGAASIILQMRQPSESTLWADVGSTGDATYLQAAGQGNFQLGLCQVRARSTGTTGGSSITAGVFD